MSQSSNPPPTPPPAEPQLDPELVFRCVDAAYVNVASIARLMALPAHAIPRIAVMAGCRSVEVLLETYARRIDQSHGGKGPIMYHDEKKQRKAEIVEACADLITALEDGLREAHKIRLSIVPQENR